MGVLCEARTYTYISCKLVNSGVQQQPTHLLSFEVESQVLNSSKRIAFARMKRTSASWMSPREASTSPSSHIRPTFSVIFLKASQWPSKAFLLPLLLPYCSLTAIKAKCTEISGRLLFSEVSTPPPATAYNLQRERENSWNHFTLQ